MPIMQAPERLRLLADRLTLLSSLYDATWQAHVAASHDRKDGTDDPLFPDVKSIVKLKSVGFKELALQYLWAIRPNSATADQIEAYVNRWARHRYSASASHQSLDVLLKKGLITRPARGRWRHAEPHGGNLRPTEAAKPRINKEGLVEEVRRLVMAFGPITTEEAISLIEKFFTIPGEKPQDNFYTMVGKTKRLRNLRDLGWVVPELVELEPALAPELVARHGGATTYMPRGTQKAKLDRETEAVLREEVAKRPRGPKPRS